jgi:tetratricopeptide (TPR) repeat protein/tRNA A-37 threonylcarbamoyl transferase component Bud32
VSGYEILSELGRGGMGVVYKARHTKLNRLIALKVVRSGSFASSGELARFRAEGKAVARMQHPNIVQIFEVEEHLGLPYFTLEFVEGGNLAGRLGGTPLPSQEAAELIEALARAVHYAHEQGIVHRDLKPSNVLLTKDKTPKITDFGLAKNVERGTGLTQTGAILGTPEYMAPEQARGQLKQVGPLADVYALGAILYECLTGRPPFKAATNLDTLRQVESDEPVSPRRLQPTCPPDLDTICLKCLQKEPKKRYASALALADDLLRFGQGKPIQARRTRWPERAWRWCRRKPAHATVIGIVAAIPVVVAIVSCIIAYHLDEARQAQYDSRIQAEAREEQAKKMALGIARLVEDMEPFGIKGYPFPVSREKGRSFTDLDNLEFAAKMVREELRDEPVVQATLMVTIGNVYRSKGRYHEAAALLGHALDIRRKQLVAKDPDIAACLYVLAWVHQEKGNYEVADLLYQEALQILSDRDHIDALRDSIFFNLAWLMTDMHEYATGEAYFGKALANRVQQVGSGHRDVAVAHVGLAINLAEQQRFPEAFSHFLQAGKFFQNQQVGKSTTKIVEKHILAGVANAGKDYEKGTVLLKEALEITRLLIGDEHPYVTIARAELGLTLGKWGKKEEAEECDRHCLNIAKNTKGYDHPRIAQHTRYLADLLVRKQAYHDGVELFEELLRRRKENYGDDHRLVADTLADFGQFVGENAKLEEAERLLREALKIFGKREPHRFTRSYELCLNSLGAVLAKKGEYAEAEALLRKSLPLMENRLGKNYRKPTGRVLNDLAWTLMRQGKHTDGALLLPKASSLDRDIQDERPKDMASRAVIYSLAARAVVNDMKLSPTERDKLAEQYAGVAVELLRRAHAGGYFNDPAKVDDLKKGSDLDPLRSRQDFTKLLTEVTGGRKPGVK